MRKRPSNPSGRPKVVGEVQELARKQGPEAIKTLISIMNDKKGLKQTRMAAACALLDRGYGKPMQSVMQINAPLTELSDGELAEFIRHAREMAAGSHSSGSGSTEKTRH